MLALTHGNDNAEDQGIENNKPIPSLLDTTCLLYTHHPWIGCSIIYTRAPYYASRAFVSSSHKSSCCMYLTQDSQVFPQIPQLPLLGIIDPGMDPHTS